MNKRKRLNSLLKGKPSTLRSILILVSLLVIGTEAALFSDKTAQVSASLQPNSGKPAQTSESSGRQIHGSQRTATKFSVVSFEALARKEKLSPPKPRTKFIHEPLPE